MTNHVMSGLGRQTPEKTANTTSVGAQEGDV